MLMALTYKTFCIFPYVRDFKLLLFVYLIDVSSPSVTQFQLSMINFATEFITQVLDHTSLRSSKMHIL